MVDPAYLDEVIRRAKPGKDVSRSARRIPHTWKGHAQGILEAIHPNRHDEKPNEEIRKKFSEWLNKENLHIRKEIVLQRSMRASGFHPEYSKLCKHPYAPECCLELIDNLSYKHKATWGDVAGWVVELSQLPDIDKTNRSTMSRDVPYASAVSFCMPKSVHSKKTDTLLLALLKSTGFGEVKRLSKDLPRFRGDLDKIYPLICISNRPKLRRDLYIHLSVNEGFDLLQAKTWSVSDISTMISRVASEYEYMLSDGPLKMENPLAQIARAVLTISGREDDAKALWDGLSRQFTNENTLDRLISQDSRIKQVEIAIEELSRSAKTADSDQHKKGLQMRVVKVFNSMIAFISQRHASLEGTDASKILWWMEQADNDQMFDFLLESCKSCKAKNDRVKSKKEMHHASGWLMVAKYVCGKIIKGMLPAGVVEFMSTLDPNRVLNRVTNKRIPNANPENRLLKDEELSRLEKAAEEGGNPREKLLIALCIDLALRRGALNRMKYKTLFDSEHNPRLNFMVLEKGKKYRECAIERAHKLLEKMKEFSVSLRAELQDESIAIDECYIFNEESPLLIPEYSTCIPNLLKNVSKKAGIDSNRVSSHVFRHTKVANLVRSGNDIHRISKFIGHSRTETTETYYDIRGVEEVVSEMKNVYDRDPTESKKVESFTESRLEHIILQRKLAEDLLLACLDELKKNGLLESMKQRVPDLDQRLESIRNEVCDTGISSVTTSSNMQERLDDFIDEDTSDVESCNGMSDDEEDENKRERKRLKTAEP